MMNWLIMFLSCSAFKIRHCLPFHLSQSFISKKSILWSKIFFILNYFLSFLKPKKLLIMIIHILKFSHGPFKVVEVKGGWGVEYWDFYLFFSYSYSVKTVLTLKNVKQIVTTQIIWRGQKEGKSAKECQDNFSFLL